MYNKVRGSMRDRIKGALAVRKGDYYYGGGKAYTHIPANFRVEPSKLAEDDNGLTLKDIHGDVTGEFNILSYSTVIGKLDTLNGTYWINPQYEHGYSISTTAHASAGTAIACELKLRRI